MASPNILYHPRQQPNKAKR